MWTAWQTSLVRPIIAVAALGTIALLRVPVCISSQLSSPPQEGIACRVLEAHTSQLPAVTVAVFHQREANDRARLGTLLRERDGAAVQFQTPDGQWHAATVLRLKSCFGRGLLLFPAGTAPLAEKDVFTLRFPPDGGK